MGQKMKRTLNLLGQYNRLFGESKRNLLSETKILKENYRDGKDNLGVLYKLSAKGKLKDNDLDALFQEFNPSAESFSDYIDEIVEQLLDDTDDDTLTDYETSGGIRD